MVEPSCEIYNPPIGSNRSIQDVNDSNIVDGSVPEWQIASVSGNLFGRKRTISRKNKERGAEGNNMQEPATGLNKYKVQEEELIKRMSEA